MQHARAGFPLWNSRYLRSKSARSIVIRMKRPAGHIAGFRGGAHFVQQTLGQSQADGLVFPAQLEPHRNHVRKIVLADIGCVGEATGAKASRPRGCSRAREARREAPHFPSIYQAEPPRSATAP